MDPKKVSNDDWNKFAKNRSESSLSAEEEVAELTALNTRLSRYIDRVRSLHGENKKLTTYIASVEESQIKESEEMHLLYREKIETLKNEKEKISRQVEHLGATYENIRKENYKLKDNIAGIDKEMQTRNLKRVSLEKEINTLQKNSTKSLRITNDLEKALGKMKKDQTEFSGRLKEISDITEKLSLECQSLHERLKSNSDLMKNKLEELKTNKKLTPEDEDKDGQIKNIILSFQESLSKETKCEQSDPDLISKLHLDISTQIEHMNLQEYKLADSESKVKNLDNKVKTLLEEQKTIEEKLKIFEKQQDLNRNNHENEVQEKDREIEEIMEKIRKQEEDIENLLLEKQGLDAEIAVFRKLVETEEERLGVKKDDGRMYKKPPGFTFVGEKEATVRRGIVLSERQL